MLAALRVAQLLSIPEGNFDHEFHALGTLALDLDAGTVRAASLGEFFSTYQYLHPATVLTQLMHAALAVPLGPTSLALRATSILAELLAVGLLLDLLLRFAGPVPAAAAVAPWLLPIGFAVEWQLLPYANHTEFLFVAVLLLRWSLLGPAERLRDRRWALPAALTAAALYLYPPVLSATLAAAAVLLARRHKRERWPSLALVRFAGLAAVLLIVAAIRLPWWLPDSEQLATLLTPGPWVAGWELMLPGRGWGGAATFDGPSPLGIGIRWLHAAALLGAVGGLAARGPQRRALLFAVIWSAAAFAIATAVNRPVARYYLPAYYGTLLCASILAVAPRNLWKLPGVLLCVGLAVTTWEPNRLRIQPEVWERTRHVDTLGMTARLGVRCASPDESARYVRLIEHGPHSPWTGLVPRRPGVDPPCAEGRHERPLAELIHEALDPLDEIPRTEALVAAGRGAWIAHDGSIYFLDERLRQAGIPDAWRETMLEGAALEAEAQSGATRR